MQKPMLMCGGQLPPKQLGQMQLFIGGGQEKKLPFFFYPKQAIANKAAKMSDLALLL